MLNLADETIKNLNKSLGRCGESIIFRRMVGAIKYDFNTKGMVSILMGEQAVKGSNGKMLKGKVIISPTDLDSILPVRVGDKIICGGFERNVEMVDNKRIGDKIVRVTVYFEG